MPIRQTIIAEARSWIGTPYRHRASVKGVGTDCLGLVRGVWRALYGSEPEDLPAYGPDWAAVGGEATLLEAARRHLIARKEAMPGDVLLMRWRPHGPATHLGILSTAETMIHAYDGLAVTESPLGPAWQRRIAGVFSFPGA